MQLAYGYAMTIHTAQGSTATEHIFALPAGSKAIDGLSGYTANTRHRHAGFIVTNELAEQIEVRKRRPLNDVGRSPIEDRWANVARAMSFQPEPDSATALRERAQHFRRGAVREFHHSLPPDPRRQNSRQHAVAGPRAVERRRHRLTLERVRATMRGAVETISRRVVDGVPAGKIGDASLNAAMAGDHDLVYSQPSEGA